MLAPQLVARVRAGTLTVAALTLLAVGAVVMATAQTYAVYVATLPVAVLLVPAVNAGLAGYAAAITPHEMQGRLASIMGLTGLVAGPLIPLVGAGLLERYGIGTALVVLAGLLAGTVGAIATVRPLWRIGTPQTWADDSLPATGGAA